MRPPMMAGPMDRQGIRLRSLSWSWRFAGAFFEVAFFLGAALALRALVRCLRAFAAPLLGTDLRAVVLADLLVDLFLATGFAARFGFLAISSGSLYAYAES